MLHTKILMLRKQNNLSQKEFAERTGVSYSTFQSYEYGTQSPKYEYLEKLSSIFNIKMSYFINDEVSNVVNSVVNPQKSVVNSVVNPKSDSILIPVYDEVFASAGFGRVNDENISFYASFDKAFLKSYFKLSSLDSLSFIRCDGDSMTPTLPPNARLLAQHRTEFKEGQIVLAKIDEDLFVKRLQKQPSIKLLSDNAAYESIALQNKQYELLCVIIGFLNTVH